ncbi:MAG: hypothetical protein AAF661_08055 [Pseudomonadota bacterium]
MPFTEAQLVIIAVGAGIVFVTDLVGNSIAFNNRIVNALVTAILFAIVFAALGYFKVW